MSDDKIVFAGDSITKATDYGVLPTETFAYCIGISCGYATANIINAGKSSDTAAGVNSRLTADVISHFPDVCALMIGINDYVLGVPVAEFKSTLMTIASRLQVHGIKLTLISSNMRRGDLANFVGWDAYLQAIEEVVAQYGLGYVDFYREMVYKSIRAQYLPLYVDSIHLNAPGHAFCTEFCTRPINKLAFLK
jgi:lysophospholipase L1-like esterase